jgi:hypothetical protein
VTTEKPKKRKATKRAETASLKAARIKDQLPTGLAAKWAENEDDFQLVASDAGTAANEMRDSQEGRGKMLKEEIRSLRSQLAEKTSEYRALEGRREGGESGVVKKVVSLLSQEGGATKARLIAETGARKGYIDALLNRILPARGYEVSSLQIVGERMHAYSIDSTVSVHAETAVCTIAQPSEE